MGRKSLAALLAIAILAGAAVTVDRVYRRAPASSEALVAAAVDQHRPAQTDREEQSQTDASIDAATSLPAHQGKTGSISGRVIDCTISRQAYMALTEAMSKNQTERFKTDESLFKLRPGVEIHLCEFREGGLGQVLRTTRSNDAGRYAFSEVPPGRYALHLVPPPEACASHDGKPDNSKSVWVTEGQEATADFRIQNGISVRGRITDTAGRPVSGAHVTATSIVTVFWDQSWARVEEATSQAAVSEEDGSYTVNGIVPANLRDASGLFAMGGSPGGVVEITASAEGYATTRVYAYAVTGALAQEARLFWDEFKRKFPELAQKYIDSPPATVPLSSSEGNSLTNVDVTLPPTATVSGALISTQGRALADTPLSILFVEEKDPLEVAHDAYAQHDNLEGRMVCFGGTPAKPYPVLPAPIKTDASGSFSFTGLSAATYRFEAVTAPGRGQQTRNEPLEIRTDQQVAGLQLIVEDPNDRLTLKGIVVDASSRQPLDKFSIRVMKVELPGEVTPVSGDLAIDEQQKGRFSITGISPGLALIEVNAEGYGGEQFRVDLRKLNGSEETFPLDREALIVGRVTVNGEPKGTQVTAKHVDGWPDTYADSSNETGEYTIEGLKSGEYAVSTYTWIDGPTRSTQRYLRTRATLVAGESARLDFDFTGTASISGTMLAPKELLAAVGVLEGTLSEAEVSSTQSDEYLDLHVAGAWDFRDSDTYKIPMLPAGTYTVVATLSKKEEDGKRTRLDLQTHTLTLAEGENAELNFEFSE